MVQVHPGPHCLSSYQSRTSSGRLLAKIICHQDQPVLGDRSQTFTTRSGMLSVV
jgi:hypothetical protein